MRAASEAGRSQEAAKLATEAVASAEKVQTALQADLSAAIKRTRDDEAALQPMVIVFSPFDSSPEAAHAADVLGKAGFVMGKKKVFRGRGPDGPSEIRFFRNPEDRAEAAAILERLQKSAGLAKGRISYVRDPDITRARYFEVRLATDAFTRKNAVAGQTLASGDGAE